MGKMTRNKALKKVFINCPFDDEYLILLRPLLFTVIYLEYTPLISSQRNDSGEVRLNKILSLIKESELSIHDLSRVKAEKEGDFFRLNMPFELGIDWGYRYFSGNNKPFLVLEADKYTASRALSDFSGCDPENHNNEPEQIVTVVRDWLINVNSMKNVPGASYIWDQYNFFYASLFKKKNHKNKDIEKMKIPEFIENINTWIENQKNTRNSKKNRKK